MKGVELEKLRRKSKSMSYIAKQWFGLTSKPPKATSLERTVTTQPRLDDDAK